MTIKGQLMNPELRMKIVETVFAGKHGHIPSAFSIIDILEVLYRDYLKFDPKNPDWPGRDYFILSKGHGAAGLYAVLFHNGLLTQEDIDSFFLPKIDILMRIRGQKYNAYCALYFWVNVVYFFLLFQI